MKYLLTAAVSIMFGVILGGIKPKQELRKIQKEFGGPEKEDRRGEIQIWLKTTNKPEVKRVWKNNT